MKFITGFEGLQGKTIKSAASVDCGESAALIFTDDTCAFFAVKFFCGSHDLELICDPDDYLKRDAGIISEAQYELIKSREEAQRLAQQRKRELKKLEELQAKYGS